MTQNGPLMTFDPKSLNTFNEVLDPQSINYINQTLKTVFESVRNTFIDILLMTPSLGLNDL